MGAALHAYTLSKAVMIGVPLYMPLIPPPPPPPLMLLAAAAQIPYFNAPIYLENKTQIGKVEEILGSINNVVSTASQPVQLWGECELTQADAASASKAASKQRPRKIGCDTAGTQTAQVPQNAYACVCRHSNCTTTSSRAGLSRPGQAWSKRCGLWAMIADEPADQLHD
jgi:rRNA processing protein Gar1